MTAPLYDTAAAAAYLGLTRRGVVDLLARRAAAGKPVGRKVGSQWILTARDLATLARRKTKPGPGAVLKNKSGKTGKNT